MLAILNEKPPNKHQRKDVWYRVPYSEMHNKGTHVIYCRGDMAGNGVRKQIVTSQYCYTRFM